MAEPVNARVWLKRSLLLIVIGMLVQTIAIVEVTPATFILYSVAGVGPVMLGIMLFGYAVWRSRAAKAASASAPAGDGAETDAA